MTTMLQLCQQVYAEIGTRTVPSAIASSIDVDIVQMLALMNAVGYELQREWQWQALTQEYRFTMATFSGTGNTTNGVALLTGVSPVIALANLNNYQITGNGIPQDTYGGVVSGGTTTALSNAATSNNTGSTYTFTQTKYPMPADYDRLIDGTQWDKSRHWQMIGPETMQQKEWLKSGYISTGPRIRYYLQGNTFQVWPPGGQTDVLGFDYVSNYWVTVGGGSAPLKTSFTADTDTCVFPDRLMVLGTKLKYFEIKSFDTTALYRDYMRHLDIAKSSDQGAPTLSMAPMAAQVLINWNSVPDSGYGS